MYSHDLIKSKIEKEQKWIIIKYIVPRGIYKISNNEIRQTEKKTSTCQNIKYKT